MNPQTLLKADNISHSFDRELYRNVNLSLDAGESAAIIGRSGSGKSTLLHNFSTFLKPLEGKVTLLGEDIYALSDAELEIFRRYQTGMIFQFHYLFKGMSALENIEIATILSGKKLDMELLRRLEIEELMSQKISELSGGQQQRVSIARVLAKEPKVIFADEPTGNLDKETASLVMDVLLEYVAKHQAALLLVTHDEAVARRCDFRYRLDDQKLELIE